MSEEQPKRLFAVTITASRTPNDGVPEVYMQSILVFSLGDPDIPDAWLAQAREVYPESDGWTDHKAIWIEIGQGTMLGPFRLTWGVENTVTEIEQ